MQCNGAYSLATQALWALSSHNKGDWSSGKESCTSSAGNFRREGGALDSGKSTGLGWAQGFKTLDSYYMSVEDRNQYA